MANPFTKAWDSIRGRSDDDGFRGMELIDLDDADDFDGEFEKLDKSGSPIGTTAQVISDGYVASDDPDPQIQGSQRFIAYQRMIQDFTIVAASLRLFLNLIAKSNWSVNPPVDNDGKPLPGAQEIADIVASMMNDIEGTTWARTMRRISMFVFQGFSIHEWTAKMRDDGHIAIGYIGHRPQSSISRWQKTEAGPITGIYQRLADGREVLIPREKIIYAVDDSLTDHPEGMGLFRHIRRATKRLRAFEDIEQIGFENDLRGIPMASIPISEIDKKAGKMGPSGQAWASRIRAPFLKFIQGHVRNKNQGIMLDSATYRGMDDARSPSSVRKWAIDLLQGDGGAFDAMANAIRGCKEDIALALGTEHLLVGQDGAGSLALSKTKTGTFFMTVIATVQELVDIMERDWRTPICEMNGWPKELWPMLSAEEIRDEDIEQITSALERLVRAGGNVGDEAIWEVLDMMGLPRPKIDEIESELDLALNADPLADPILEE